MLNNQEIFIPLRDYAQNVDLLIGAHRGYSALAPENTLSSIKMAIDAQVDLIEIDLQLSSDLQVVVYHNRENENQLKPDLDIENMTFSEIAEIDFGSWFGQNYATETIPLLSQAFDLVKDKAYLIIELKSGNKIDYLAKLTIDFLKQNDYLDKSVFGSFDLDVLRLIRSLEPKAITSYILQYNTYNDIRKIHALTDCDVITCHIEQYSEEVKSICEELGLVCGVYGIDNETQVQKAKDNKIFAVVGNDPKYLQNQFIKK